MKSREKFCAMGAALVCGGLLLTGSLISSPRRGAQDPEDESDSRIRIGFEIAPVLLDLEGKNPALVGLGSYIVNTEGCNDCHSAGPPTQYAPGGNPYLGQPKKRSIRRRILEEDEISVRFSFLPEEGSELQ